MSDDYDTRREEADPEVIADLQLRARTQRERRSVIADLAWQAPIFVASWKCRHPKCDERVAVTQDVVHQLEAFSAELVRRGGRPIPADSVLVCATHEAAVRGFRAEKLREQHVRLAANIRELKQLESPGISVDLLAKIRADHHPDVEGLIGAIEARTVRRSGKRKAASL